MVRVQTKACRAGGGSCFPCCLAVWQSGVCLCGFVFAVSLVVDIDGPSISLQIETDKWGPASKGRGEGCARPCLPAGLGPPGTRGWRLASSTVCRLQVPVLVYGVAL